MEIILDEMIGSVGMTQIDSLGLLDTFHPLGVSGFFVFSLRGVKGCIVVHLLASSCIFLHRLGRTSDGIGIHVDSLLDTP